MPGADQETRLLERFPDRRQRQAAREILRRCFEMREQPAADIGMQRLAGRHRAVGGIEPPAGEDELPRHEGVARVPPPEEHFRLRGRAIDHDERGGVPRLDQPMKAVALAVDDLTRDLHDAALSRASAWRGS